MKRVVITGLGMISPLGNSQDNIWQSLKSQKNSVSEIPELSKIQYMNCHVGCTVSDELPEYPRKKTRSMGRVGLLAVAATEQALLDAGLSDSEELHNGATGIAYGSSAGTSSGFYDISEFITKNDVRYLNAQSYIYIMPHTVAVNLGIFFNIQGRIIPTSSACTSASQAIGYAYESIKHGEQTIMIAGGSEEFTPFHVGVFDALFATTQEVQSDKTPRPFDVSRDGIVIGEGAGTLIIEEYEHAKARNAKIYAEIIGFGTNCDATHITNPSSERMHQCMNLALSNAQLKSEDIDYVNAHGTGTVNGDLAEGLAMNKLFENTTPISTLKSYMGHTLGACGALELGMSLLMQQNGWFAPNLNLKNPDPQFDKLNLITGNGLFADTSIIMSNNFAFGGINTSIIVKRI